MYDVTNRLVQGADPGQHTITRTSDMKGPTVETSDMKGPTNGISDMEGLTSRTNDTKGFEPEASGGTPARNRRVRFALPRQPSTGGDSSGGVGGHAEVCKIL